MPNELRILASVARTDQYQNLCWGLLASAPPVCSIHTLRSKAVDEFSYPFFHNLKAPALQIVHKLEIRLAVSIVLRHVILYFHLERVLQLFLLHEGLYHFIEQVR